MFEKMNQGGRYASAGNTDVAKFEEQTMNHKPTSILANFDRDTFMSQLDRLDAITQQAFVNFLNRLVAMTDEDVLNLTHQMGRCKWQQSDELWLVGFLVNMFDDESTEGKGE